MSKKDIAQNQEPAAEEVETAAKAEPEQNELQEKLDQALQKQEEMKDQLLRTLAEYDNYRKRTEREKAATYDNAVKDTVGQFLNIVDTLEMALAQKDCKPEDLRKGVEMIGKNLQDVLEKLEVSAVGQVGEPFDPELHQAVSHVQDPELSENVISAVYRKGYRIGDKMIRHATVVVAN